MMDLTSSTMGMKTVKLKDNKEVNRMRIKIIQVSRRAVYDCPHCNQYVSIDLSKDELTTICPLCGQDITKEVKI